MCNMKTGIVCVLAFLVLANEIHGLHAQIDRRADIRDVNPYKHLLRTKRTSHVLQVCEPGATKKEDYCNDCFCTADGSGWGCTRMMCIPDTINNPGGAVSQLDQNNPLNRDKRNTHYSCEPRSQFQDDCNTCICGDDGRSAACTLMACLHRDGPTRNFNRIP